MNANPFELILTNPEGFSVSGKGRLCVADWFADKISRSRGQTWQRSWFQA